MKNDVKKLLAEKNRSEIFTDERYGQIREVMKYGMTQDPWLKNYLSLDPFNKAQWISDFMIKFVDSKKI